MSRSLVACRGRRRSAGCSASWAMHPRLLAAGESPTVTSSCSRNRNCFGPGDHVHRALAIHDGVAIGAKRPAQRQSRSERRPPLLEHDDLETFGTGDRAGIGGALAGEDAQQAAFAAAVGAEQAELRSGRERHVKIREQRSAAERQGDAGRVEQLARLSVAADEVDASSAGGSVAVAQLVQLLAATVRSSTRKPALRVRRPPCGPATLSRGEPGSRPIRGVPALEKRFRRSANVSYAFGAEVAAGIGAVDLDDRRQPRAGSARSWWRRRGAEVGGPQRSVQPDDAGQIEMIRRLIEQQQVGPPHQFAGQGRRCAQPPERMSADRSRSVKPTCVSVMAARVSLVLLDRFVREPRRRRLHECCGQAQIGRPGRDSRASRYGARGCPYQPRRPARIRSRVDFPEPLGPISLALAGRRSDGHLLNSGRGPKLLVSSWPLNRTVMLAPTTNQRSGAFPTPHSS